VSPFGIESKSPLSFNSFVCLSTALVESESVSYKSLGLLFLEQTPQQQWQQIVSGIRIDAVRATQIPTKIEI